MLPFSWARITFQSHVMLGNSHQLQIPVSSVTVREAMDSLQCPAMLAGQGCAAGYVYYMQFQYNLCVGWDRAPS